MSIPAPDPEKKLAALQNAGMLKKGNTLPELLPYITHNLSTAVSTIAEAAIEMAKAAGQAGAAKAIGDGPMAPRGRLAVRLVLTKSTRASKS